MTAAPGAEGLTELARRLAPQVVEEAIAEAREVARCQVAQQLAQEIARVALEGRPTPRTAVGPPAREPGTDHGLYVYGIVRAGSDTAGLEGLVAGAAIDAIERGPVSLVVSDVDLSLLRDLEEDLSETGRLAGLARRHDEVLRQLMERGGVLPLRFGTVLTDAAQAFEVLDDPEGTLPRTLEAVQDAREWGFRVDPPASAPRDAAADGESEDADAGAPGGRAGSGTAYLTSRRQELRAQEARREALGALVERADHELATQARDAARRQGGRAGRLFDCAYLVRHSAESAFLSTANRLARELGEEGCVAEVTGPWPPYSFVHITLGGVGDV